MESCNLKPDAKKELSQVIALVKANKGKLSAYVNQSSAVSPFLQSPLSIAELVVTIPGANCLLLQVAKRLSTPQSSPDFVIGADTCVTLDGTVYGKPKDRDHAFSMLSNLSGRNHEVLTGVCLMVHKGQEWQEINFSETTTVNFATLSPQVINAYIDTGEPMDKAGGYGIQALGGMLIEGIQGDYYNVMGFPLHRFCQSLVPVLEEMFS
ncbi:dTTP/UTP pyrophosphatase-like [Penaeus indicus]|uniref:dTTP/UTP pyrophosphatase-like n=1 Tax=Penaeus indicus TaxID=29960 RepID=UPI00300DAC3B